MQIGELLQTWIQGISGQLFTLILMIVVQFVLAVVVAWRDHRVEWSSLADFYRTRVIPYLVGYVALVTLSKWASPAVLGPDAGVLIGDGVSWGAWLILMTSLAAKIITNLKDIFGPTLPIKSPDELRELFTAEAETEEKLAAEVPAKKPAELSGVYQDQKTSGNNRWIDE